MRAKQQLGQNFLMHQKTADRIAASAGFPQGARVVEIGPGTGMLTRSLIGEGAKVTAIETDSELIPGLLESFSEERASGAFTLIEGDIRTFDLGTIEPPYYVVANIPYYITGEIIRLLLTTENKPVSITLLVQKEVAVRVTRSEKESLLSLSVKAYGTPKYLFTVPRGAFRPSPNVDSAVLQVQDIHTLFGNSREEAFFFEVLHAGFGHKRKKLRKNLEVVATPEQVQSAFSACSLDENVRSEDISLPVWRALVEILWKEKNA